MEIGKRGRGRPKGSKNKAKKEEVVAKEVVAQEVKNGRGRPKGVKNGIVKKGSMRMDRDDLQAWIAKEEARTSAYPKEKKEVSKFGTARWDGDTFIDAYGCMWTVAPNGENQYAGRA